MRASAIAFLCDEFLIFFLFCLLLNCQPTFAQLRDGYQEALLKSLCEEERVILVASPAGSWLMM